MGRQRREGKQKKKKARTRVKTEPMRDGGGRGALQSRTAAAVGGGEGKREGGKGRETRYGVGCHFSLAAHTPRIK